MQDVNSLQMPLQASHGTRLIINKARTISKSDNDFNLFTTSNVTMVMQLISCSLCTKTSLVVTCTPNAADEAATCHE
jgi:hypothetical protein